MKTLNEINWWHRIKLPNGEYTPGRVFYGEDGGEWPTTRFGMPEDLTGKTVLDVGAWDGFFSFEAEKRGAIMVLATDIFQNGSKDGFDYAHAALSSKVQFAEIGVHDLFPSQHFDYVLFYGVLYHLDKPIEALGRLFEMTYFGGTVLIETTIGYNVQVDGKLISSWEFRPGFEGDNTNKWYPSLQGLIEVLKYIGFSKTEVVWASDVRATVRCIK